MKIRMAGFEEPTIRFLYPLFLQDLIQMIQHESLGVGAV